MAPGVAVDTFKLDIAVGLLTRESKHRLVDDEGRVRWVTADPLIYQLQQAIGNTSANGLFKSSSGNPLPLAAQAHIIMEEIRETTIDFWWRLPQMVRAASVPRLHHAGRERDRSAQVRLRLRYWATAARASEADYAEAVHWVTKWVDDIESMFHPVRVREIRGACPECGFARVLDREDEGERFMKTALALVYAEDGSLVGIDCAACRAHWGSDEVLQVARQITRKEHDNG